MLRPLYTAEKERCVPIVCRLGLGVVALTAVRLRSFSASKKGMSGFAADVRCT
jgi:hypothetical protein